MGAGDHNIATNPKLDRYPPRIDRDFGRSDFLDIMFSFDLRDTCRAIYLNTHCFTFRSKRGSQSRIDKICVSSNLSVRDYTQEVTGHSDHDLIKACIIFESAIDRGPGIWKNNIKHYNDDAFVDKFSDFWQECIGNSRMAYVRKKINWWMDFKYKFKLFYIKFSREKLIFERRHNQILEDGLNNALQALTLNPNNTVMVNNYYRMKKALIDR